MLGTKCQALLCQVPVVEEKLMCSRHWGMVPVEVQRCISECLDRSIETKFTDLLELVRQAQMAVADYEEMLLQYEEA